MEEENETNYDSSKFEKPSVTVDLVVFTIRNDQLYILLIKRGIWPFKDCYALPGGFVRMDEKLKQTAIRELFEETSIKDVYLKQVHTFSDVDRDPRTRVITVAYLALINSDNVKLSADTDAKEAKWFAMTNLPKLAFDHNRIIDYVYKDLRLNTDNYSLISRFFGEKFTLTQMQKAVEAIHDHPVDKRNFRKKIISLDILEELDEVSRETFRPARLYSLKKKK
ncbi:MAG: NUDIX hydrolase [Candidatus Aenigmarchaeota archaeon]|nr:NUDIX hydrolase [Candidatus Aenigmarchaeota archaeon]